MALESLDIRVRQQGARTVARDIRNIGFAASAVSGQLSTTQRVLRGLAFASVGRRVAAFADSFTNLNNRVRLYTDNQQSANKTSLELINIANRARVATDAVSLTFQRLAINQERLGLTTERVTRLTETLSKAVAIGGSNAQEAGGALRQFSQAISSGFKAAAQELNSVLEQTPGLANALADGLGTTVDQIKRLAREGQLNSDIVIRALESQAEVIEARFSRVQPTIGQAFQILNNSLEVFVGRVFSASDAGRAITGTIIRFSQALINLALDGERLNRVIEAFGTLLGTLAIRSITIRLISLTAAFDGLLARIVATTSRLAVAFTGQALTAVQRLTTAILGLAAAGASAFARTLPAAIDTTSTVLLNLGFLTSALITRFTTLAAVGVSTFTRTLGHAIDTTRTVMLNLGFITSTLVSRFQVLGASGVRAISSINVASLIAGLKALAVQTAIATARFVQLGAAATAAFLRGGLTGAVNQLIGLLRGGLLGALRAVGSALTVVAGFTFAAVIASVGALAGLLFGLRNETVQVGGEAVKVRDIFVAVFEIAKDRLLSFADTFLGFFGQSGDGISRLRGFFNVFVGLFTGSFRVAIESFRSLEQNFTGLIDNLAGRFTALGGAFSAAIRGDLDEATRILAGAAKEFTFDFNVDAGQIFGEEFAKDQLQALTDLIGNQFPELRKRILEVAAARREDEAAAYAQNTANAATAAGVRELTFALTDEQEAVAKLVGSLDPAAQVALDFLDVQSDLEAAVRKGVITAKEQDEILQRLGQDRFRRLAAETDEVAAATIEYNDTLRELSGLARVGAIGDDEFAAAVERVGAAHRKSLEDIRAWQLTLSDSEGFVKGAQAGFRGFTESLGTAFSQIRDLTQNLLDQGLSAIDEFVKTGEFNFKEFALNVIGEIQKVLTRLILIRTIEAAQNANGLGDFFSRFNSGAARGPDQPAASTDVGSTPGITGIFKDILGGGRTGNTQQRGNSAASPLFVKLVEQAAETPLGPFGAEGGVDAVGGDIFGAAGGATAEQQMAERQAAQEQQVGLFESLITSVQSIPERIQGFFQPALDFASQIFQGGFEKVTGFLGFGTEQNSGLLSKLTEVSKQGFGGLLQKLAGGGGGGGIGGLLGGFFGGGGGGGGFGGGGGGGGIGSILGLVGSLFGGFAEGGILGPSQLGTPFLVGEQGPEIFVPKQAGTVVPNDNIAMGGAAPAPPVNVQVVNVDDASGVPSAMSTREGEEVILNTIQRNRGRLKEIIS